MLTQPWPRQISARHSSTSGGGTAKRDQGVVTEIAASAKKATGTRRVKKTRTLAAGGVGVQVVASSAGDRVPATMVRARRVEARVAGLARIRGGRTLVDV